VIFINIRDNSIISDDIAIQNGIADSVNEKPLASAVVEDYQADAEELKFALTYMGLMLAQETERNRDIILGRTVHVVKDSIVNTEKYIYNRVRGKRSL
jgi:hypothetical protein